MDDARFDLLAAALATGSSRRRLLGSLVGGVLAGRLGWTDAAAARRRRRKKKKKCPFGRPACGNECCLLEETCRRGRCRHRCEDGVRNAGESDADCGRVCDGVLGTSPFGRCPLRKRCEGGEDCRSAFCGEITPGAGKVCIECNEDRNCDIFSEGRPRCLDHFCFECAADFDCPGQSNPPEERFCVSLPVAAGLNEAPCPPGQPCVCRECRSNGDCPEERPHCQTGTGTVFDGQCFECVEDIHCPQGSLCNEEGRCESFFCNRNRDCPSGCCDLGECVQSFDDNINHCGACGRTCNFNGDDFLTFCFRCCNRQCRQFPRAGNPNCDCP